jgi:hypothetical protein
MPIDLQPVVEVMRGIGIRFGKGMFAVSSRAGRYPAAGQLPITQSHPLQQTAPDPQGARYVYYFTPPVLMEVSKQISGRFDRI